MRPAMIETSSPYNSNSSIIMNAESPKSSCIWSTERRLLERPPPCRPQKKSGRRPSCLSSPPDNCYETSTKKQRNNEWLLLPSRTINEDDTEFSPVALNFRQTNLTSIFDSVASEISIESSSLDHVTDPTTVLLIPETSQLPWYSTSDDEGDENDDEMILSPRLFQFSQQQQHEHNHGSSGFTSIDLEDDYTSSNNNIFRALNNDEDEDDDDDDNINESRDIFTNDHTIHRRSTWASSGFTYERMPSEDDDDRH